MSYTTPPTHHITSHHITPTRSEPLLPKPDLMAMPPLSPTHTSQFHWYSTATYHLLTQNDPQMPSAWNSYLCSFSGTLSRLHISHIRTVCTGIASTHSLPQRHFQLWLMGCVGFSTDHGVPGMHSLMKVAVLWPKHLDLLWKLASAYQMTVTHSISHSGLYKRCVFTVEKHSKMARDHFVNLSHTEATHVETRTNRKTLRVRQISTVAWASTQHMSTPQAYLHDQNTHTYEPVESHTVPC